MPFVRQRGNRLAIVHGVRDPKTGYVEQQLLFTLCSKPEALEATGPVTGLRFRALLENQYPGVRFPWKKITEAIKANMGVLPDKFEYGQARLQGRFRQDLCQFAKQIMLADPHSLASAAQVLEAHAGELTYLADLIQRRLRHRATNPSEFAADNEFYWRFTLRGTDVPSQFLEEVEGLLGGDEHEQAEMLCRLLIECFGDDADLHTTLGRIEQERGKLDPAIAHFRKAVEVGRSLFPKHLGKKWYWSDTRTRPYMTALNHLAGALNQVGKYKEAESILAHLAAECGDRVTADASRSEILLNQGRWTEAARTAERLQVLYPYQSLIAAFAQFELESPEDSTAHFLHGALHHPRAASMLLGVATTRPTTADEAEDHNTGVAMKQDLAAYLKKRSRQARDFFRSLLGHPHVKALQEKLAKARADWSTERMKGAGRDLYDLIREMESPEFARAEAKQLLG